MAMQQLAGAVETESSIPGTTGYAEACQDVVDYYLPVRQLIEAEAVYIDFDDSIATHNPDSQYWVALHTLLTDHCPNEAISASQFVRNFELTREGVMPDEVISYLDKVREVSYAATGDPGLFEQVADAFRQHTNDGHALKQAIKAIPLYPTSGPFWESRARLLRAEGVSPAFGLELMPGVADLIDQLKRQAKDVCVISNSRRDLIVPALNELFADGAQTFTAVAAVGGTGTPIKPAPDPYIELLAQRPELEARRGVYIGNSREDVAFAGNIGMPVIILGDGQGIAEGVTVVGDVAALSNAIRRTVDGASLARFARRAVGALPAESGELRLDMTPAEVGAMAAEGLRRLWESQAERIVNAYNSPIWSDEYLSLKHIENFADIFDPILGGIRVPALSRHPVLANYFTDQRIHKEGDTYGLRGRDYYLAVDNRLTAQERVHSILGEIQAAVATVEQIDRRALRPEDLLCYLGVLDNAKQQALSLFHAITYAERRNGIPTDEASLALRQQSLSMAVSLTRCFYEACVGRPFSTLPSSQMVKALIDAVTPNSLAIDAKGLKMQELDHPPKIMLAAYALAAGGPAETVVGFPSGGTQIAIVTALAVELAHGLAPNSVDVVSIPLSSHSGTTKHDFQPTGQAELDASVDHFASNISGRRVIIVDDNSSTGTTLERGSQSIQRLNPLSARIGVGEMDPKRMLVRARQAGGNVVQGVVDLRHNVFASAAGVVPISGRDVQLRKERAGRILQMPSWNRSL